VVVDTGVARFELVPGASFPFRRVSVGGAEALDTERTRLLVEDTAGLLYDTRIDTITVEEHGPLRVVVCVSGAIVRGRRELLDVVGRLHFFANLPTVRIALTLRNPRAAKHPGGIWELGDSGSVALRDVALSVVLRSVERPRVTYSAEAGLPLQPANGSLELYQDSSGGENWRSSVHVNAEGRVPNRFRGYRVRQGDCEKSGLRATPHVAVIGETAWASVAMAQFWQNFPKAIEAEDRSLALRLWPRQYDAAHELQGGEQKTHVLHVSVGQKASELSSVEWCRHPSSAVVDPEWYCSTGAVPHLTPASTDRRSEYLQLVSSAIEGPNSFARKREVVDEYGWRHFGELYADHEAAFHDGPQLMVSHYNNQYDAVGAFARHFMRSGNVDFLELMNDLARHVVDIDIYHTDRDKAAYNQGLFWHTCHYVEAGRSTHRSYPKDPKVGGGGQSNEHNYSTGLMLHYFMTGDRLSRDAVIGLARWVVQMDDGNQTVFRWLARGNTGLASQTASAEYHGPGRGAGHSIHVLLDGHRLTGDRPLLEKAEQLIRRTVHPDDNPDERNLLDREARWSYTAYLQELGRYLDYKAELGELDGMYAYARASLLTYATWMAANEYPYLDKPEELEFPNETWAAQDVRKSEVFDFAARHASDEQRSAFLERADFFWRYSVTTLAGLPTRTLTRPLVLMLGHGFLRACTEDAPERETPIATGLPVSFGPRSAFVPQKARAKRRFVAVAMAAGSTVLAAAAAWLFL
jgi:hypothetical protein